MVERSLRTTEIMEVQRLRTWLFCRLSVKGYIMVGLADGFLLARFSPAIMLNLV